MGQAQPDRCRRRRLQGHDHADGAPAGLIEADTEVGPADRLAFPLVHNDHIDDRVIDLHLLQDPVDAGDVVTGGMQRAGGIRLPCRARPAPDAGGRSSPPPCSATALAAPAHTPLPDLPVDHRDAALLPGQEPFADRLGDDRLHPVVQPTLPRPPSGLAGMRSVARPEPAQNRCSSTYIWRRETPSSAAASSIAATRQPLPRLPASSAHSARHRMTSACRNTRSHRAEGSVRCPSARRGTGCSSPTARRQVVHPCLGQVHLIADDF